MFRNGVADHAIKELCRIYVSRSVLCEFCGNQRSMKAAKAGIVEDDYSDLINFESSTRYSDKQKAALAYAEMITWDLPPTDEIWARLHKHFSEPELVEIGYFVALTMGQQRWLRTLEHRAPPGPRRHRRLDGAGLRDEDALKTSKAQADYWAKKPAQPQTRRRSSRARLSMRHETSSMHSSNPRSRIGRRASSRTAWRSPISRR